MGWVNLGLVPGSLGPDVSLVHGFVLMVRKSLACFLVNTPRWQHRVIAAEKQAVLDHSAHLFWTNNPVFPQSRPFAITLILSSDVYHPQRSPRLAGKTVPLRGWNFPTEILALPWTPGWCEAQRACEPCRELNCMESARSAEAAVPSDSPMWADADQRLFPQPLIRSLANPSEGCGRGHFLLFCATC